MDKSDPTKIEEYLKSLAPERERAVSTLRDLILETIPEAWESFRYKMPTYEAAGDFLAAVASQKHYLSLYMSSERRNATVRQTVKMNSIWSMLCSYVIAIF